MAKEDNNAQNKNEIETGLSQKIEEKSETSDSKSISFKDSTFSDLNFGQDNEDTLKVPILLKYNAYKRMICYALRYAREELPEKTWKEVYGILIGSINENKEVVVKDAIPMLVGERAGVKYESKQYVDMAEIDESIYEKSIQDKKNDFIIGWWHTHPGFKFMFSDVDKQTHLGYQIPNPLAIGLIFNHMELKSNDFYLGVAALRIRDPYRGILATYDYVDIKPEFDNDNMVINAEKEAKQVIKNIDKVIKELEYIDSILRKRYLAQLQENFGLILIPKDDVKLNEDSSELEDNEKILYEWNPDYFKTRYRIPKFRGKVEAEIDRFEKELLILKQSNNEKIFETKKKKYKKKIKSLLSKPGNWLEKLSTEFAKRVDIISPYFDYLDTNERKIIETFELRSSEYRTIYNELQSRGEFNL